MVISQYYCFNCILDFPPPLFIHWIRDMASHLFLVEWVGGQVWGVCSCFAGEGHERLHKAAFVDQAEGIWTELWWDRNGAKKISLALSTLFIGGGLCCSIEEWQSLVMWCSFRRLSHDKVSCRAEWSWMNDWTTLSSSLCVVAICLRCHVEGILVLMCGPFKKNYALLMHFVYLVL